MSLEEKSMRKIFGAPKWKDKYEVDWCHLCNCAIIICPECKNSSCNCGGCPACVEDHAVWKQVKTNSTEYLTPEEAKAYQKGLRLQHFIVDSIERGQNSIDWQALKADGRLSKNDEEMFKNLIWV